MMLFKRQRLPYVISINTNCNYKNHIIENHLYKDALIYLMDIMYNSMKAFIWYCKYSAWCVVSAKLQSCSLQECVTCGLISLPNRNSACQSYEDKIYRCISIEFHSACLVPARLSPPRWQKAVLAIAPHTKGALNGGLFLMQRLWAAAYKAIMCAKRTGAEGTFFCKGPPTKSIAHL
jgi:hypothetical protein